MPSASQHPHPPEPRLPVPLSIAEDALDGGGVAITVRGELDIATAPALRSRLNAAVERGVTRLVVDLSFIDFLDSTALAVLVGVSRSETTPLVVVVAPDSYTHLIFTASGVGDCLNVVATRDEAIARTL